MLKQKNNFIPQIEPNISKQDIQSVYKYMKSGSWITEHKQNTIFENRFKKIINSKYAVSFPNGTLTLFAILKSLNIGVNDEVIVPSYTMVATANSVELTGAVVSFADIDSKYLCLSYQSLKERYSKKVKAVIYVTLNGRSGEIDKIKKFCKEKKIYLIEDSAHSLGSYFGGKIHHGNKGIASSFSFSMPKLMTTGQGGMVITKNQILYDKLKKIKNFGRIIDGKDDYSSIGYNLKFTDLQAALGISQLTKLKGEISRKKKIFKTYFGLLKNINEIEFKNFEKNETPWFVDIYIRKPKDLKLYLNNYNIGSRLVYPSLNKLKLFKTKIDCPISEYYTSRGLWLPSSTKLKESDINRICQIIKNYFKSKKKNSP